MLHNLVTKLGEWNPQLFREIKGNLKSRNVTIAVAISLLGQILLFGYFYSQLPFDENYSQYCILSQHYECLKDGAGNLLINWQKWCQAIFINLSGISIFLLLVVGTYLIINNLSQEESRGTLNFIRMSPRSEVNILMGKLLGVPILLYLVVILAIPLYLWIGFSAHIPLGKILSFWAILVASSILFYSAALLCSLVGAGSSSFLGLSGGVAVLFLLFLMLMMEGSFTSEKDPSNWLRLFSPFTAISYLFPTSESSAENWSNFQWYYLPLSAGVSSFVVCSLFNYGLWTYWIWQAVRRCFRNPNATILSKGQSYAIVASFEVMILGFALPDYQYSDAMYIFGNNLTLLSWLNLILLLGLIATLLPQRQNLQDWARYKHVKNQKSQVKLGMFKDSADLVWGEKSPGVVAIGINLAIAATPILFWILLQPVDSLVKTKVIVGVLFLMSWMMIFATIAQLALMMKSKKRPLWAAGIVATVIFLPPTILGILSVSPEENPIFWLFSSFFWVGIENATNSAIFIALLGEWTVLGLLNLQLVRQLQKAGESATKKLIASRSY